MCNSLSLSLISIAARSKEAPQAAQCPSPLDVGQAVRAICESIGEVINRFNVSLCSQAPRPSPGPHKKRECIPLIVFLRNRLKYALTGDEVKKIVKQRLIKVDGKIRTDTCFPAGYMGKETPDRVSLCSPS